MFMKVSMFVNKPESVLPHMSCQTTRTRASGYTTNTHCYNSGAARGFQKSNAPTIGMGFSQFPMVLSIRMGVWLSICWSECMHFFTLKQPNILSRKHLRRSTCACCHWSESTKERFPVFLGGCNSFAVILFILISFDIARRRGSK